MRHQTHAILLLLALAAHHIGAQSSDCLTDDQCGSNEACRDFQCVNPCQTNSPCVENSECKVSNHSIECSCQPGFIGDAYTECITANRCSTNDDCDSDKTCASDNCVDPCTAVVSCGENTKCSVVEHSISCDCLPGYSGNAYDICNRNTDSENTGNEEGAKSNGSRSEPDTESVGTIPTIQENNPENGINQEGNRDSTPPTIENTPSTGENNPDGEKNTDEIKPALGEDTTSTGENRPGADENKPGAGENRPGAGEYKPGAGENKPEFEENRPPTGGHTHETGGMKPDSWTPPHNKYHAETSVKTDWHGAMKMCKEKGKRLASVTSRHDNDQILQTIARTKIRKGHFWTAGTDHHKEGHWVWETTGHPFNFTFWHFLQPDNLFMVGGEDCMGYKEIGVHIASGYKWNDKKCDHHAYAICEEINDIAH